MRLERVLVDETGSAGLAPDQDLPVHGELVLLHLPAGVKGLVARYAGPADFFLEILRHFQFAIEGLEIPHNLDFCLLLRVSEFFYLNIRFHFFTVELVVPSLLSELRGFFLS